MWREALYFLRKVEFQLEAKWQREIYIHLYLKVEWLFLFRNARVYKATNKPQLIVSETFCLGKLEAFLA
jgi:hypothetical protein